MPDFSPLPSPSNNPLQNLKVIAEDKTIYLSPPNNGLGKTGSSPTWSGLTWGDDGAGDGTASKPFATLKRAWEEAQKYVITGNATLYIQFQKGIYGYTYDTGNTGSSPFPTNLYHPQGNNIIIQGDLSAIKQRYIYRVKNYSWDLSRMAYYGHTGTVNTWYAVHAGGETAANYPLGTGITAHGFSFEDELQYVSISNAYMNASSVYGYRDALNGVNSAKYTKEHDHNFGRYMYNHGLSYEEAYGIVGLARIEGASANNEDLRLQFKYINLDGRINTYPDNTNLGGRLSGGLGNGISYSSGSAQAAYPEPQYSQPNGFYGPTFGIASDGSLIDPYSSSNNVLGSYSSIGYDASQGVSIGYPSRNAGEVHVTDDAHLLTNFPVVIKTYTSGTIVHNNGTNAHPIPLVVSGAEVKSIRNLMFVNGNIEGATYGSKPPIMGWDHQTNAVGTSMNGFAWSSSYGMFVDNGGKTSITNLGFLGYGLAGRHTIYISRGGTLTRDAVNYMQNQMEYDAGIHNIGSALRYAELGAITNCPTLVISHGGGIYCDGPSSRIDFSTTWAEGEYTNQMLWIQAIAPGNYGIASTFKARSCYGPINICYNSYTPGYMRLRLDLPQFPGATVSNGNTAAFFNPEIFRDSRGTRYKSIVAFKNASGTRTPVLRVTSILDGGNTYLKPASEGWTTGTWTIGTGTALTQRPVKNQAVLFDGQKLNTPAFDTATAIKAWLNSSAGNTLEFFAYSDGVEGVTMNEYLGLSKGGIVLGTSGGITLTCSTINGTTFGLTASDGKVESGYVVLYGWGSKNGGHIVTTNDGEIHIFRGNVLTCGRCYNSILASAGIIRSYYGGHTLVRDFAHSGLLSQHRSIMILGGVHVKHPWGFGYGGQEYPTVSNHYNYGIYTRYGGYLSLGYNAGYGDCTSIGLPFSKSAHKNEAGQYMGFYNIGDTTELAINPDSGNNPYAFVGADSKQEFTSGHYVDMIGGFDGGNDAEASHSNAYTFTHAATSKTFSAGAFTHIWNVSQGQSTFFISPMTRGTYTVSGNNGNGSQLMYNAPRGATMWWMMGLSGWVAGNGTPSISNNMVYKERIAWTGAGSTDAELVPPASQRVAAFSANPPGYSGPGVSKSSGANVSSYYSTGGG